MTIKELEEQSGISVFMRSCWECNSAHERLKKVDYIILYFVLIVGGYGIRVSL